MGIRSRILTPLTVCFALALGATGSLHAAAITGTFTINGSVRVSATAFDWAPLAGGTGTVTIGLLGNSGYFAALAGTATIDDLVSPEATPGNPVPNFLTGFGGAFAGFFVDQALFAAPSAPACTLAGIAVNSSCTLGNSTLTQLSNGVTVSLNFTTIFKDGVNTPTPGTASFTTQLSSPTATVPAILTVLGSPGGFIDSTYSATLTSIPEPATYALLGLGLLAAVRFGRRKA